MEFFEVISTNRACRHFLPDPVPDELIERVLDAAVRAPSGSNRQTWRFLVLRDPAVRATIGGLYREGYYEYIPERLKALPGSERTRLFQSAVYLADHMASEPPVLIMACLEQGPNDAPAGRIGGASIYPAVQNLMLAARALGLGTCLTTLHMRREQAVKEALGIPRHVDTYALIPIGYPVRPFGTLRRLPVEQVTFFDRWDQSNSTTETE